jgi:hypothetical protein
MTQSRKTIYILLSAIFALTLTAVLFFVFSAQLAQAADHDVHLGDSIQAAIHTAAPGDTIRVEQGLFTGNLVITKSLTLLGGFTDFGAGTRVPGTTVLSGSLSAPPAAVLSITNHTAARGDRSGDAVEGIEVAIDGFEVTGGSAGGVYVMVDNASQVVIRDNLIHDNDADQGAGIYAQADFRSTLEISGNQIQTNTATLEDGGVYATLYLSGTLVLRDNQIVGNTSVGQAGGLHIDQRAFGIAQIEDNLVMSNTATGGSYGGLYISIQDNSRASFNRNQIIGNQTGGNYGGGRLFFDDQVSARFDDNLVRDNQADGNHGGIRVQIQSNSQVVGTRLVLADNTAGGLTGGGEVYLDEGSVFTMTQGLTVTGNQAGNREGGIRVYAQYSKAYLFDLYVFDNHALGGDGGGYYFHGGDADGYIYAPGLKVISNTASGDGGGGYLTLTDGSIADLPGGYYANNHSNQDGGGLYNSQLEHVSSLSLDGTQILSNTAGGNGGGACLHMPSERSQLEANNLTVISNTAMGDGGGIYFVSDQDGGVLSFTNNNLEDNRSGGNGGGLYAGNNCYDGCTYLLDDNHFTENHADGSGGAFYQSASLADEGSLGSFSGNRVIDNTAGGNGGGLYLGYGANEGSQGFMDNNRLVGNTAGGMGGGIYFHNHMASAGSTFSFQGNWIQDNRSIGDGGGVRMVHAAQTSMVEFISNTISENLAVDGNGAGIYMEDITHYGSRTEFSQNLIIGNVISSTDEYNGGGVHILGLFDGDLALVHDNVISGNLATGQGGGFYWGEDIDYGSVMFFQDNQLLGNRAKEGGGCVFERTWEDGGPIYFDRNLVSGNQVSGEYAGCMIGDINQGTQVYFRENQFVENLADGNYGGLYIKSNAQGSHTWFKDNQITRNQAGASDGGALGGDYAGLVFGGISDGAVVDFSGNLISGNQAYQDTSLAGGDYAGMYAVVGEAGLLRMEENTISENSAGDAFAGLAIEVYTGVLILEHNLIQDNNAAGDSGGLHLMTQSYARVDLFRNRVIDNSSGLWLEDASGDHLLWSHSENNLIAGNAGGGILLLDADFESLNDTIAGNGPYGILMTGTLTSTAQLSSTILWNHDLPFTRTQVVTYTDRFNLVASDSDIQGGWPGARNIDANPLFAGSGDYHLQEGSPAVNQVDPVLTAAIDLDGIPRPVPIDGLSDMGCYEFHVLGVDLSAGYQVSADPGTVITLTHLLTNTGDVKDTFSVQALSKQGWSIQIQPALVTLMPEINAALTISVSVPAGLSVGVSDTITVTAWSLADPMVMDALMDEVEVALVPGLVLTPDLGVTSLPGQVVIYEHVLTNSGNGMDTFELSAVSSQGWGMTVTPQIALLSEGESAMVEVWVYVPRGTRVGTEDLTTVTAVSQSDVLVSATVEDTTRITDWPYKVFLPWVSNGYNPIR